MVTSTHTAQTLDRGLQVLEAIEQAHRDVTIAEVARALRVHRTIAHRLMTTLQRRELLARTASGRYRLGSGLTRLAGGINRELRAVARPYLMALNAQTDETVHLAILSRAKVIFVDGFESSKALRVVSRVGRAYPAYATSVGKAMLANLSDSEIYDLLPNLRLVKLATSTVGSRIQLQAQLATVRKCGYAANSQEAEDGVGSIAVAIVDQQGATTAALSIAAPLPRFSTLATSSLAECARRAAREIGLRL